MITKKQADFIESMMMNLYGLDESQAMRDRIPTMSKQQASAWISSHISAFREKQKQSRERERVLHDKLMRSYKARMSSWRKQGLLKHTYADDLSMAYYGPE